MTKEKNRQLGGKIVEVVPTGLCFVEDASSGKIYPFTFDKIRGYLNSACAPVFVSASQ
jgi:hypothetical protein